MQDAFAYCAELVRTADRDRYLASLFAPEQHRGSLLALYAFNVEIAQVRDRAREALPGEIRLQWWHEVLDGGRRGEADANPVAAALLTAIDRYRFPVSGLLGLIEAHRFDLFDEPMPTVTDLETYAAATASTLIGVAANILGADAAAAAGSAGLACGITGVLRAFPFHAARHQLYVPAELLQRFGAQAADIFAGRSSPELAAALAALRDLARRHLRMAHDLLRALPPAALPAFLPVAPVRLSLDLLDRSGAFTPAELPQWRRQWLIWRAARNPARIAA